MKKLIVASNEKSFRKFWRHGKLPELRFRGSGSDLGFRNLTPDLYAVRLTDTSILVIDDLSGIGIKYMNVNNIKELLESMLGDVEIYEQYMEEHPEITREDITEITLTIPTETIDMFN